MISKEIKTKKLTFKFAIALFTTASLCWFHDKTPCTNNQLRCLRAVVELACVTGVRWGKISNAVRCSYLPHTSHTTPDKHVGSASLIWKWTIC